jgi:DNA-binding response OmpR family regulator
MDDTGASASATPTETRGRILVVNDTPEILELLRDILEEAGFEVALYSYASRDLDDVKRVQPDLIVLDFIIGGEDRGWQLLQKLKLDRETASIPVVVCTAAVGLVRELEGHLRAKGVSVVLKPFDIDDLVAQVEAAWQGREPGAPEMRAVSN